MHITSEILIAALRSQGLRITRARRAVCSIVAELHNEHLTAARILQEVRARDSATADQSTVYRTLDALEEANLLVHSHLGHGPAVYHLASEAAHQHVVCRRCGATASVPTTGISAWLDELQRFTGFVVDPTHFAVTGLCPDCVRVESDSDK
jgi:Fur family transcriptional regulator, ferric uptake regulator